MYKDKKIFQLKPRFLESGVAHLERQKSQRQRYAFGIAIEKTPQTSKHEKEWQGEGIGRGKSGKKYQIRWFWIAHIDFVLLSWMEIKICVILRQKTGWHDVNHTTDYQWTQKNQKFWYDKMFQTTLQIYFKQYLCLCVFFIYIYFLVMW